MANEQGNEPVVVNPAVFVEPSNGKIVLHPDQCPGTQLRNGVFGHANSILTFKEGVLAKLLRDNERRFYMLYEKELSQILSPDLVPEIRGLVFRPKCVDNAGSSISFDYQRSLICQEDECRPPMLLEGDMTARHDRPAVLDIKLGRRSWRLGASNKKVSRRSAKMAQGCCPTTCFRVRGGTWSSDNPTWERRGDLAVVTRKFGNTGTMEELKKLFADFFKHEESVEPLVAKLRRLSEALKRLRDAYEVRFYSSSVLLVYDEAHPERTDVRMLDFQKTYVGVDKLAETFGESVAACEDDVVAAVDNIAAMIEDVRKG